MRSILLNLLRINFREPFSFLYNLAVPLGVLLALLFWREDKAQSLKDVTHLISAFGGYTIYSSSCYGVGLLLAQWREEGLLITFCKDAVAVRRLLIAQGLLRSMTTCLYVAILLITAAIYFGDFPLLLLLRFILGSFFLSLITSWLSMVLLMLPWSPRDLNASVGLSIFIFIFLLNLPSLSGKGSRVLEWMNLFNPIAWNANCLSYLEALDLSSKDALQLAMSCLVFLLIGSLSLARFHRFPVIARL